MEQTDYTLSQIHFDDDEAKTHAIPSAKDTDSETAKLGV